MSLTAFVTGATGFVGSRLAAELCSRGWAVHVLARPSSSLQALGELPVVVHLGDVVDAASIAAALPEKSDASTTSGGHSGWANTTASGNCLRTSVTS